ncbi:MAG: peptidase, partial [Gammaproteobacteria bacterium]|nr:peptidase [Gammaproteobacteria bacterium]
MQKLLALIIFMLSVHSVVQAATFNIINLDVPGEGFKDGSPVTPVTGNSGTTLGQQRLNAFQAAADFWGATLQSSVTIDVEASMDPDFCTATS